MKAFVVSVVSIVCMIASSIKYLVNAQHSSASPLLRFLSHSLLLSLQFTSLYVVLLLIWYT